MKASSLCLTKAVNLVKTRKFNIIFSHSYRFSLCLVSGQYLSQYHVWFSSDFLFVITYYDLLSQTFLLEIHKMKKAFLDFDHYLWTGSSKQSNVGKSMPHESLHNAGLFKAGAYV